MATTTNYSWATPDDTDLVKDGAAAIRTLGSSIDTTVFNNAGAAIAKSIVDAKGDLIAATAADAVSRLAVGADGTVLTADSNEATGIKWATTGAVGKVLQVVQATTSTAVTNTTTSFADSGLSASITPSAATSKVLVIVTQPIKVSINGNGANSGVKIMRDSTDILVQGTGGVAVGGTAVGATAFTTRQIVALSYLDSPATTSALTYKTQGRCQLSGSGQETVFNDGASSTSVILLIEIGA